MDKDTILWLILFVIFLGIEVITVGLTSIWFAIGSLAALVVSLFEFGMSVQIVLFVVVTIVLLFGTKPFVSRWIRKEKTNYESVIGQKVKVTEQISNIDNKGTVMINGLEWTARAKTDEVIEVGEIVEVIKVEGVKVIVKK